MVQGGKYGFLDPMTYNCLRLVSYYDLVMVVCVGVMVVVVSFLAFALCRRAFLGGYTYRFGKGCNWLEFCWTLFPGGILGALGYVSWENLYEMELTDSADYYVKVVGHQWYWEYEYFLSSQFKTLDEVEAGMKAVAISDCMSDSGVSVAEGDENGGVMKSWSADADNRSDHGDSRLSHFFARLNVSELSVPNEDNVSMLMDLNVLSDWKKEVEASSSGLDGVSVLDSSARADCSEVFAILGSGDCSPFKLVNGVNVGDVHLSYDSYGVSMNTSFEDMNGVDLGDVSTLWPFLGQGGVTQPLYIPVNKTTEVKVCTADVIHSWGVPSLGVKMDAVPGRVNHLGVHPYSVGLAYGNCYELCGYGHSVMPVCVAVVSKGAFHGVLNSMLVGALED